MKPSDFKDKNKEELNKLLVEKRDRLETLQFKLPRKEIKNYKEIGFIKKDIARILTAIKLINKE